jgi:uncharacterized protein (DUF427 family)
MTEASAREHVTLATETIHNPKEPRHFMRIKPAGRRVRILRGGKVLADSNAALRVIEAGRDLYDPVLYLPRADVTANLAPAEKDKTFCPIKGHATYFDLVSDEGSVEQAEIAWSYEDTLDCAAELKNFIGFYGTHVLVEEHPAGS